MFNTGFSLLIKLWQHLTNHNHKVPCVSEPYEQIISSAYWIVNNFQARDFENFVAFNIQVFPETTRRHQL